MRQTLASLAVLLGAALPACGGGGSSAMLPADCTTTLSPSSDDQTAVQTALINAKSGDKICFDTGTFKFTGELSLTVPNVTLEGPTSTPHATLDFKTQTSGAQGMYVTGDHFTIQNLDIKNTIGDGIRVEGTDFPTFRNLHVSWDGGSLVSNGAYSIYPVTCNHVLIEGCEVEGASDAGIYVGQSKNVIVRNNKVHGNVAGLEIENSTDAEVYGNHAFDNTAGILVFNLPNLPAGEGARTLVHDNESETNNRENFAKAGNIVSFVPAGIGMLDLANDFVEYKNNNLHDNSSTGLVIASYLTLPIALNDPKYDPYPETISIHDNTWKNNGQMPQDTLTLAMVTPLEDIVWDGRFDAMKDNTDGHLTICIKESAATFRNVDDAGMYKHQSTDVTPHLCTTPPVVAPVTPWF